MPLAVDQRYCLNCGRRRGEPRVDFRRHLAGGGAALPAQGEPLPVAAQSGSDGKPQRDFAPLAAAGGIAVLGLMLLVGVLIGRGDGAATGPAPAPIVRVQGEGGATTASDDGADAKGEGGAKKAKSGGGSSKGNAGGGRGGGAAPPAAITADDSELESLQGKSPQEYSEASAKLPNEIATEGKPPPEDSKKPGGGSAGTTIE